MTSDSRQIGPGSIIMAHRDPLAHPKVWKLFEVKGYIPEDEVLLVESPETKSLGIVLIPVSDIKCVGVEVPLEGVDFEKIGDSAEQDPEAKGKGSGRREGEPLHHRPEKRDDKDNEEA